MKQYAGESETPSVRTYRRSVAASEICNLLVLYVWPVPASYALTQYYTRTATSERHILRAQEDEVAIQDQPKAAFRSEKLKGR